MKGEKPYNRPPTPAATLLEAKRRMRRNAVHADSATPAVIRTL